MMPQQKQNPILISIKLSGEYGRFHPPPQKTKGEPPIVEAETAYILVDEINKSILSKITAWGAR